MPTITFSLKDLQQLVGEKIPVDKLAELLEFAKSELEKYDKETDEVTASMGDTNQPYLWSVEGVARLLKGLLGKEKGLPAFKSENSNYKITVEKSVSAVRPFIAAFAAKGCRVDDYLIKQLISLQEKFCEGYGRRRQKVAIGVYNLNKIKFPVSYKATFPESVKFTPLEFKKEMTQQEILDEHPKGKEYAWILKDAKKYPLLIDYANNVLSFPPIINSNFSGKIEVGDSELFFEATGTDEDSVLLAANIFSQAFYDRGFKIYSVETAYPDKSVIAPHNFDETLKIDEEQVKNLLGLELKEADIRNLLEKFRYGFDKKQIKIPFYRRDIMHPVDVIEDIAIAYGYNNIPSELMKTYTAGKTFAITGFIDKSRELIIGLGYQEIFSAMLTNKETMHDKMNVKDSGIVEIKDYMSERFSIVRSWLMPILFEFLAVNRHVDYPQKIFEEGICTERHGNRIEDYRKLSALSINNEANFTEARQAADSLLSAFGIKYEIEEYEHDSFIPGRVGAIIIDKKDIGFIGEISPQVLSSCGLEMPVAGFEINLTKLFELVKK